MSRYSHDESPLLDADDEEREQEPQRAEPVARTIDEWVTRTPAHPHDGDET
jgi:hypothetical protein